MATTLEKKLRLHGIATKEEIMNPDLTMERYNIEHDGFINTDLTEDMGFVRELRKSEYDKALRER